MSEWIRINDVIPSTERLVLIADFSKQSMPKYLIGSLGGCKNCFNWRDNTYKAELLAKATHWMPLPEPPEVKP